MNRMVVHKRGLIDGVTRLGKPLGEQNVDGG